MLSDNPFKISYLENKLLGIHLTTEVKDRHAKN